MRVLVLGSGGREHALAWKIARSPRVARVFCAPGNAGIAAVAECVDVAADDFDRLVGFVREAGIDLTVVGPEAPLCAGIVDRFQAEGLRIFGPNAAAAELEGSKSWAKALLQRHQIPTAASRELDDVEDARVYLGAVRDYPVVVKADGLTAGKGVAICANLEEALAAVEGMMTERRFGDAGRRVLIEEFLVGEEASIMAMTDGQTIAVFETSQDHKQVDDGDRGPMTGGMGAFSPASKIVTDKLHQQIHAQILVPLLHGLARAKRPYVGFLFVGLMITKSGPKVLEVNVRLGDPEAQVLLMRLKSDLVELMELAIDGKLQRAELEWDDRAATCVVLASGGYPGSYATGLTIHGLDAVPDTDERVVFHAATTREDGRLVTAGGRVLGVTTLGATVEQSRERAYAAVKAISWDGVHYRTDIGRRAGA